MGIYVHNTYSSIRRYILLNGEMCAGDALSGNGKRKLMRQPRTGGMDVVMM